MKQIQEKLLPIINFQNQQLVKEYKKYYHIDDNVILDQNYQNERDGKTIAMWIVSNKKILPDKQYHHDTSLQNKYGFTVAMLIALYCNQLPSKEWQHDPTLKNNYGCTMAICIASYCKQIPPKQWLHDTKICDNQGWTVAHWLNCGGIKVPPEWQDGKYY